MQQLSIPVSVGASGVAAQKPAASTTTKSVAANRSNPALRKTRSHQKGNQKLKSDQVPNSRRRYMAGILPIRRKTQNNQSINHKILGMIFKTWNESLHFVILDGV